MAECGADFALETTLSGRTYIRMIREWRAREYSVKLIFLSLRSAEQAIARVAERVKQGGHHVPEDVIRRRFINGLENFYSIYRHEVDFWQMYDNSGDYPILLEEK